MFVWLFFFAYAPKGLKHLRMVYSLKVSEDFPMRLPKLGIFGVGGADLRQPPLCLPWTSPSSRHSSSIWEMLYKIEGLGQNPKTRILILTRSSCGLCASKSSISVGISLVFFFCSEAKYGKLYFPGEFFFSSRFSISIAERWTK